MSRLSFGPGLNVFWTPDAGQRRRVIDILYHTLHPSSDRFDATAEYVDPDAAESRAAVSYTCKSGDVFRLSRDLRTGAGGLYRGDEHAKFSLVTREPIEIVRCMRMYDSIPEAAAYERCLMLNADSMPSLGEAVASRSGAPWNDPASLAPVAPGMSGFVSSSQVDESLYKSAPRPFVPLDKGEGSRASAPATPPETRSSAPALKTVMGERAPPAALASPRLGPPVEPTSGVLAPSLSSAPPQAPAEQWYAETTQDKVAVYRRLTVALDTVHRANEAGRELDGLAVNGHFPARNIQANARRMERGVALGLTSRAAQYGLDSCQ